MSDAYQDTLLENIRRTEAQLAAAVVRRDAAEVALGIRRGEGCVEAQGAERAAARQELARAQGEIEGCLANLNLYHRRLDSRPVFDPTAWGVHKL